MSARNLIAAALVAALVAGLVLLYIEVRSEPAAAPEVAGQPRAETPRVPPPRPPAPAVESPVQAPASVPPERPQPPSRPPIHVRPVPGAQMPDEITRESLADIKLVDAAPEGSETARVQSVARLFNQRRYDEALEGALGILAEHPENFGVRRTAVSIACVTGDAELAREHYQKLPEAVRSRVKRRCENYGIDLEQ